MKRTIVGIALFCGLKSGIAHAYPEFIGYGYTSCLTCHFNGLGGGPLNDYGRALWSAEISSRALYPKTMDDEAMGNQSGFLGSVELPAWLRPHVNYRGLNYERNFGSTSPTYTWLNMQEEFGVTVQNDDSGKFLGTVTFANIIQPQNYGNGSEGFDHVLAREAYVREEIAEGWWIYIGLMEKVFGLRNDDHESPQRKYAGFYPILSYSQGTQVIQNKDSAGVILHRVQEKWETAVNLFAGNPYDTVNLQAKGASALSEIEIGDRKRLGASVLTSQSNLLNKDMAAIHYRQGISKGSSFLGEYGFIHDQPAGAADSMGSYTMGEAMVLLTRGYNLKVTVERYNQFFNPTTNENWTWDVGLLSFPLPRVELRADLMNQRILTTQSASPDQWFLEGQIHVSL